MKNLFLTLVGLGFIAFCIYLVLGQPAPDKYQPKNVVKIGETYIQVEIRDTPEEREQGLSGREFLAEDAGMLFVFETPGKPAFWMKDMNFPIDIIWIDSEMSVVEVHKDISPETFPQIFSPSIAIKYVLEVPAGFAKRHAIDTGSRLYFTY